MPAILSVIMPFLQKYWMYIAGALGLLIIFRKLGFGGEKNLVNEYKVSGATISTQLALAYAERLYNAMAPVGTDEDEMNKVYNDLKQNPANVALVYNAFGLREYGLFGSPWWWTPSEKVDLREWIKRELSGKDHDKWMSLFNSVGIV